MLVLPWFDERDLRQGASFQVAEELVLVPDVRSRARRSGGHVLEEQERSSGGAKLRGVPGSRVPLPGDASPIESVTDVSRGLERRLGGDLGVPEVVHDVAVR